MKTLILPVAGRSSRFPGMRPKWLLTMPDGKLMLEKSVELFDLSPFDRVVVVCLKEHISLYLTEETLKEVTSAIGHKSVEFCILDEPTSSQSETVEFAIQKAKISGSFFVKDCDNMFKFKWDGSNQIAVLDLNDIELIDAKNKSYVISDALDNVNNIIEKQVISNLFCCGGYGFHDAEEFVRHFRCIKMNEEIYISHVIYSMLMNGIGFKIKKASDYTDWGTLREFRNYTKTYFTLFCDVDGVLLYNGSKFGKVGWATEPIIENLETISKLQSNGKIYLVVTSSRPESEIQYLNKRLAENGVFPDRYLMGLPHSRRVLVNDFSATNPFPSAVSVNLARDSKILSDILGSIAE
jgi:hypothetical protein